MNITTFIQIGLPIALALMMLSMGMSLKIANFKHIAEQPKAFFVGLSAQMLLVPLLALLLVKLFQPPPLLAVGLLIVSFSPGGTTSNFFSYLAKGDVALSVTLTVVASFITPFTIPLLTELALQAQMGQNTEIIIPIALTMKRLLVVTIVPAVCGMLLRVFKSIWVDKIQAIIHNIAISLFLLVIALMIFNLLRTVLPSLLLSISLITSTMILIAMIMGYFLSKITRLSPQQIKTNTIEIGMQNGGMALIVTQTVLNNDTLSIVPMVYGLLMLIPILLFVFNSRAIKTT